FRRVLFRSFHYMFALLCTVVLSLTMVAVPSVSAHAILLSAQPSQGSHIDESPDKIVLTFNERLGGELYQLKVYDKNTESVTDQKATLNKNRHKLRLKIPELKDGVYTVQYKVISADGHPVDGLYTFSVGDVSSEATASSAGSNLLDTGHEHSVYGFA